MRAVFGVISLLLVVAIVGFVAGRQLKELRGAAPVAANAGPSASAPSASPRATAQQVADEMRKATEAGAARRDEADK